MKTPRNLFFILKPSQTSGIGVFPVQAISRGSFLPLNPQNYRTRLVNSQEVPAELLEYCIARGGSTYECPEDFARMELSWYLNLSFTPNITRKPEGFIALCDIAKDQELLLDYNDLGEPNDKKEDYYLRKS